MPTTSITANGLTFCADVEGEGDSVALLLHGFPECRVTWRAQLEGLSELGWKVVAPDLRGYGESSRPEGLQAYKISHLVDDVAALFEALGARRRILIGHDWGGVIAWQAALQGLPLDGLVVLNAPHPAIFQRALKTWDQRRRSWYVLFFLLPLLPELQLTWREGRGLVSALTRQTKNFSPETLEVYRTNVLRRGAATAMLNYYRANASGLADSGPDGAPIQAPTLMIWGEDDIALSPSLTMGNEEFVLDFSLRRLPSVSHWVQCDAPDLINSTISEWACSRQLATSTVPKI